MAALKAVLEKLLPQGLPAEQMAFAAKTRLLLKKEALWHAYDEQRQRVLDITEAFEWGDWVNAGDNEEIRNNLIWLAQTVGLVIDETKVSKKKNKGQVVYKKCGELCTAIENAASAKWFDTNILPHTNLTRPGLECYVHGLCGGEDSLCDMGGFGARPPPARRPPPSHSHARPARRCRNDARVRGRVQTAHAPLLWPRPHHRARAPLPARRCPPPARRHASPRRPRRPRSLTRVRRPRRHAWPRRPAPAHPPAHARAGRARCRAIGAYASAAAQRMRPRATSRRRASSSSSSPGQADRG